GEVCVGRGRVGGGGERGVGRAREGGGEGGRGRWGRRVSGSRVPAVNPKLWKSGNELKSRSHSWMSQIERSWRTLARMLVWVNSTPLGMPSEPLVNKMTAVSFGMAARRRSEREANLNRSK